MKFRVWDKLKGEYLGAERNVTIAQDGALWEISYDELSGSSAGKIGEPENYLVEEFTDLLDAQGKEVYEGDRAYDKDLECEVWFQWWQPGAQWLIYWYEKGKLFSNIIEDPDMKSMTVTGTIHDPEFQYSIEL